MTQKTCLIVCVLFANLSCFSQLVYRYSEYEPNYILSNFGQNNYGQVKFKISFKYDLGFNSKRPKGNKVFFAYTQYAFWDIYQPSAPMRELNFTPMFMYSINLHKHASEAEKPVDIYFDHLNIGYLHQSNGRSDTTNRSLFKVFAHLAAHADFNGAACFHLARITEDLQIWKWNMLASENTDIAHYQGNAQLITTIDFDWGKRIPGIYPIEIDNILVPAKKGVSKLWNMSFNPFKKTRAKWVPNLYLQYWTGYGESLINYDNRYNNFAREKVFRLGLQFRTRS